MPTVNGKKYPYTAKGKAAAKKAAAKTSTSYLGNVVKEVKQTAKNASNAVDKYLNNNRPLPKGMKIGPSNVKKEAGQLAGAVLQGRRYDDKTGKQIVAPSKKTATPKRVTRNPKAGPMAPRQIMPKNVTGMASKRAKTPLARRAKKGM